MHWLLLPAAVVTASLFVPADAIAVASPPTKAVERSILDDGAIPGDGTVNTKAIQATIDRLAHRGGGTVVIPRGVFVTGALFFKPGVNLRLEKEAVLKCSTDMQHFPAGRARIEGHFEDDFTPALINADHCDGFQLMGEGTLDGDGRVVWDRFMTLRRQSSDPANFKNLSVPRARLALLQNSKDIVVRGVTFKDSQFWNLHIYKCQRIRVEKVRFQVPDDYKQAPSSDGIDVDSCQDVTIRGCEFSVTDDCVAMKGSKGPFALEDRDTPPVERVLITGCVFRRGHHALSIGSEATGVRDIVLEKSQVTGAMSLLNLKLRPDTPQRYERIRCEDIALDADGGDMLVVRPWRQFLDLQGQPPPKSFVADIKLVNIRGRFGAFAVIDADKAPIEIGAVVFENIDVQVKNPRFIARDVPKLTLHHVVVNGKAVDAPTTR